MTNWRAKRNNRGILRSLRVEHRASTSAARLCKETIDTKSRALTPARCEPPAAGAPLVPWKIQRIFRQDQPAGQRRAPAFMKVDIEGMCPLDTRLMKLFARTRVKRAPRPI